MLNIFKNNTTNLLDKFRETIHINSQNAINRIHNILSQHNALLQSLLKYFIKTFSQYLWKPIKRYYNDNESN